MVANTDDCYNLTTYIVELNKGRLHGGHLNLSDT